MTTLGHNSWRGRGAARLAAAAGLLLCASAAMADPVTVRTVDGETLAGELMTFSLDGQLELRSADGRARSLPAGDVVTVQPADGQPGANVDKEQARVETIDGARLCGELIGGDSETLSVRHHWLGDVRVPLERVTRIVFPTTPRRTTASDAERTPAGQLNDEFLLRNGDRIVGTLLGINGTSLVVDTGRGETTIPFEVLNVAALAAGPPTTAPEGLRARLHLSDGSRLIAEHVRWEGESMHVSAGGQEATIPAGAIREVEITGGRWVWLTELTPVRFEHAPLWSARWDWQPDRNVLGGPIRVAGKTFRHGIGVHSESRLVFDLGGRYRTLAVDPGIDDDSGPLADVTARIVVDGHVQFERSHLTQGQSAGPQRVDVANADRLELIVLFGENGDVQDRFDWADAALVRAE